MDEYSEFLRNFVREQQVVSDDQRVARRLVEDSLLLKELPGHCCDWAAQYLATHGCLIALSNALCGETMKQLNNLDTDYLVRPAEEHSSVQNEKGSATVNDSNQLQPAIRTSQLKTTNSVKCLILDATKCAELVLAMVDKIANSWIENPPTRLMKKLHKHRLSLHAIKNGRRKMEDRHVVIPDVGSYTDIKDYKDSSYFAVFDGHGGVDAASYASAQLFQNLIAQPNADLTDALRKAFHKTDRDFVAKAERERLRSGSTGIAILLSSEKIHVAWLGDSQAVLVRAGKVVKLMDPHKPEREDEKKRIEGLGGCVVFFGAWRVNGNLSVSRAIGDADHKPYVSGEADCNEEKLTGDEDYFVLACDGLWDVIEFPHLVELVHEHLSNGGSHESVAEKLVNEAREQGSSDNITVIVVFLRDEVFPPVNDDSALCIDVKSPDDHESSSDSDEYHDAREDFHSYGEFTSCVQYPLIPEDAVKEMDTLVQPCRIGDCEDQALIVQLRSDQL